MRFGFNSEEEVARFLKWVVANPNAEVETDHGPRKCSRLREYIDAERVSAPLTHADFLKATVGDPRWRRG
jgi:hypothetical protein